jgi:hypothetical protein
VGEDLLYIHFLGEKSFYIAIFPGGKMARGKGYNTTPALVGPFYEISLKILHDLLRSSMCILLLFSNEERRVLFYIHIYYSFVRKVYMLFIFYDNKKNKSWYMCLIYNQSGFDSYVNPLAQSYYKRCARFGSSRIALHEVSRIPTAPRIG